MIPRPSWLGWEPGSPPTPEWLWRCISVPDGKTSEHSPHLCPFSPVPLGEERDISKIRGKLRQNFQSGVCYTYSDRVDQSQNAHARYPTDNAADSQLPVKLDPSAGPLSFQVLVGYCLQGDTLFHHGAVRQRSAVCSWRRSRGWDVKFRISSTGHKEKDKGKWQMWIEMDKSSTSLWHDRRTAVWTEGDVPGRFNLKVTHCGCLATQHCDFPVHRCIPCNDMSL